MNMPRQNRLPPAGAMLATLALATACASAPLANPAGHLAPWAELREDRPAQPVAPGKPAPPPAAEALTPALRYSVVVSQQPIREVLKALARDTQANIDVHPDVDGVVTLHAIDQTLPQLLDRMARQADMRHEAHGQAILVMRDTPFLRTYRVDYVNLAREAAEVLSIATQIQSGAAAQAAGDNNSTLRIANASRHRFWESLERNLKDLLRETDKVLPEGSAETFVSGRQAGVAAAPVNRASTSRAGAPASRQAQGQPSVAVQTATESVESRLTFREAASVIVNAEAGVISVRATSRQHEKVAEFLGHVARSAGRQVLIEATVVEVRLDGRHQSGVDWSSLAATGLGWTFRQSLTSASLASASSGITIGYASPGGPGGRSLAGTLKLLDAFGSARVLSTPTLMVLNNQAAVLRVTDNLVYFTVKADTNTNQSTSVTTFTTTQNVLPVGIILHITPQVSDEGVVTLGIRPTVTAKIGEVQDPNPLLRGSLTQPAIESKIPVTQTREFESVLRVASGQTAVLGGLMVDGATSARAGMPILARMPILGPLFSQRDEASEKRELVVFVRPVVVSPGSLPSDLARFREALPGPQFFTAPPGGARP